jgi:hypothetical protein
MYVINILRGKMEGGEALNLENIISIIGNNHPDSNPGFQRFINIQNVCLHLLSTQKDGC